jgi:hypothetical protein
LQPYFPVPGGEVGTQYVLRTVAPRRVWPPIAFGASVACWYEHLSRTVSIVLCKNHRLWELAFRVFTLYRYASTRGQILHHQQRIQCFYGSNRLSILLFFP